MNSSRRSASTALGAVALLAVAGAATARVCFDVVPTDMVYFLVRASETPRLVPLAGFVALFELLLLRVKPRRLLEVFAPFVLVLPFLPFPPSVNLLAAYAAAAGLTVYRAALVGAFDGKSARQFTGRLPLLSGLLTVLMCALGVLASKLAYDRLFLTMSDWGIYTAMAWNTFHGEILRGTWPVPDFSAGHFMPGFFFPMSVVFGLLPSVFTAFGCGALALWGSAVLVWLFARKRGFSRPYAAAFGLIWLLYPSVSNLNYTLFYGVNAIVSFIPVFFGFYLLYEAKRYKLAFLVFLFSLTLKETVGIFWLGWGIRGAATATILSQFAGMIWVLSHFMQEKSYIRFKKGIFKLRKRIVENIFSIGMSPFLMNVCASAIVIIFNKSLLLYGGDLAIGAYGILNRLLMLFVMVIMGLTMGMQPIVGYNHGAHKFGRVKQTLKYCMIAGGCITSLGFAFSELFPNLVVNMFTDDKELTALARTGLQIGVLMFPFVGIQIVISSFFQSIGKAKISIFLSLSRQLLYLLPCLLLLPHWWGLNGIWLSMPVSDLLAFITACLMLAHHIKKLNKITEV